jgi:hypothetical protein
VASEMPVGDGADLRLAMSSSADPPHTATTSAARTTLATATRPNFSAADLPVVGRGVRGVHRSPLHSGKRTAAAGSCFGDADRIIGIRPRSCSCVEVWGTGERLASRSSRSNRSRDWSRSSARNRRVGAPGRSRTQMAHPSRSRPHTNVRPVMRSSPGGTSPSPTPGGDSGSMLTIRSLRRRPPPMIGHVAP